MINGIVVSNQELSAFYVSVKSVDLNYKLLCLKQLSRNKPIQTTHSSEAKIMNPKNKKYKPLSKQ